LDRIASELRDGWESELHVVVDGALPMAPITQCVRRFADPAIPTGLRVDVEYQEGVIDRLNSGPADIALDLGFDREEDKEGYHCIPLAPLELLLVASPEHPLAQTVFNAENRSAHAELVVRDSSPRFSIQSKGSFMGSRNVVYLSDFYSKRVALLHAAGYGWIPRHFIDEDLSSGRLQLLNAATNRWSYQPQIITPIDRRLGRGGQLFLATLKEELERHEEAGGDTL
jgi:DNA-binding transcriptional LysR family regulator